MKEISNHINPGQAPDADEISLMKANCSSLDSSKYRVAQIIQTALISEDQPTLDHLCKSLSSPALPIRYKIAILEGLELLILNVEEALLSNNTDPNYAQLRSKDYIEQLGMLIEKTTIELYKARADYADDTYRAQIGKFAAQITNLISIYFTDTEKFSHIEYLPYLIALDNLVKTSNNEHSSVHFAGSILRFTNLANTFIYQQATLQEPIFTGTFDSFLPRLLHDLNKLLGTPCTDEVPGELRTELLDGLDELCANYTFIFERIWDKFTIADTPERVLIDEELNDICYYFNLALDAIIKIDALPSLATIASLIDLSKDHIDLNYKTFCFVPNWLAIHQKYDFEAALPVAEKFLRHICKRNIIDPEFLTQEGKVIFSFISTARGRCFLANAFENSYINQRAVVLASLVNKVKNDLIKSESEWAEYNPAVANEPIDNAYRDSSNAFIKFLDLLPSETLIEILSKPYGERLFDRVLQIIPTEAQRALLDRLISTLKRSPIPNIDLQSKYDKASKHWKYTIPRVSAESALCFLVRHREQAT